MDDDSNEYEDKFGKKDFEDSILYSNPTSYAVITDNDSSSN